MLSFLGDKKKSVFCQFLARFLFFKMKFFPIFIVLLCGILFSALAVADYVDHGDEAYHTRVRLFDAVYKNDFEAFKKIVDENNINFAEATDITGTPLSFEIAVYGRMDMLKYLKDKAGVNLGEQKASEIRQEETIVHHAAFYNRLEVLEYLHEIGTNLNLFTLDNKSTAVAAASNGHVDVLKFLVEKGKVDPSTPDKWGAAPAHWAATKGRIEYLQALQDLGADIIDAKDKSGLRPYDYAKRAGQDETVAWFDKKRKDAGFPIDVAFALPQTEVQQEEEEAEAGAAENGNNADL
jgi:hypothetical protein